MYYFTYSAFDTLLCAPQVNTMVARLLQAPVILLFPSHVYGNVVLMFFPQFVAMRHMINKTNMAALLEGNSSENIAGESKSDNGKESKDPENAKSPFKSNSSRTIVRGSKGKNKPIISSISIIVSYHSS